MIKTYSEQAITIIERQLKVAAKDGTKANHRGMQFSPKGYIFYGGNRISKDAAIQTLAHLLDAEDSTTATKQPKRTNFEWDSLNQATKDLFFNLCDQMQSISRDHGMAVPVLVKELQIGLKHAPRLSNLKKAGLFVGHVGLKKSHKMLRLTERGQAIWAAYAG